MPTPSWHEAGMEPGRGFGGGGASVNCSRMVQVERGAKRGYHSVVDAPLNDTNKRYPIGSLTIVVIDSHSPNWRQRCRDLHRTR